MGEEYNRREEETAGGWVRPGDQGGQPQPWAAEPQPEAGSGNQSQGNQDQGNQSGWDQDQGNQSGWNRDQGNQTGWNPAQTGQIRECREDRTSQGAAGARPGAFGRGSDSMAMASLVMGILSLVSCCCTCLAVVLGALGIIFAFLSRGEGEMNKQAKAGLILSAAGLAVSLLTLAVAVVMGLLAS